MSKGHHYDSRVIPDHGGAADRGVGQVVDAALCIIEDGCNVRLRRVKLQP